MYIGVCRVGHPIFSGFPSMGINGQYWSNPFMEWFKEKHACAQNFHNYKDAVKACLKSSVNIAEDLISYSDESRTHINIYSTFRYPKPF